MKPRTNASLTDHIYYHSIIEKTLLDFVLLRRIKIFKSSYVRDQLTSMLGCNTDINSCYVNVQDNRPVNRPINPQLPAPPFESSSPLTHVCKLRQTFALLFVFVNYGLIPEKEPEKRLPHPMKAACTNYPILTLKMFLILLLMRFSRWDDSD
ncbi:hypothetical protein LguiB_020529 [Lonicera macranthoides]